MNLEAIKKFSENRVGGLKKLAVDAGMSEQNLHRCIRNNKIQAADLETIALLLNVDIRLFFDENLSSQINNVETNGDFSPASLNGDVTVTGVANTAVLQERIKALEAIVEEKERLIKVLMERK